MWWALNLSRYLWHKLNICLYISNIHHRIQNIPAVRGLDVAFYTRSRSEKWKSKEHCIVVCMNIDYDQWHTDILVLFLQDETMQNSIQNNAIFHFQCVECTRSDIRQILEYLLFWWPSKTHLHKLNVQHNYIYFQDDNLTLLMQRDMVMWQQS